MVPAGWQSAEQPTKPSWFSSSDYDGGEPSCELGVEWAHTTCFGEVGATLGGSLEHPVPDMSCLQFPFSIVTSKPSSLAFDS